MKYGRWLIALAAITWFSCKKTESYYASVLLYNASWSSPGIGAAWNANNIAVALAQGQASGAPDKAYLQVPAGTNLVTLISGNDTLVNKNMYTPASTGSSFIFFNANATSTKMQVLQLTDDLTLPDTGTIKYRFIDASPDTSARADIWLVNGTADSLRLDTAAAFIGKDALASSVQSFQPIKYNGNQYTIKIKKTGTQQLYAVMAGYHFVSGGIYSIIFSGLGNATGGAGFKLSVLNHSVR